MQIESALGIILFQSSMAKEVVGFEKIILSKVWTKSAKGNPQLLKAKKGKKYCQIKQCAPTMQIG